MSETQILRTNRRNKSQLLPSGWKVSINLILDPMCKLYWWLLKRPRAAQVRRIYSEASGLFWISRHINNRQ